MLSPVTGVRPQQLCKRDGSLVAFDLGKICQAIAAAGLVSGEFDSALAAELADAVLARLLDLPELNVEQIQVRVERVLMEAGYYATARAYIVYRESHIRLRRDRKAIVEVAASMNEYLSRADWRVQANANQGYSLGGLVLNVAGKVTANYWLDEVYSADIGIAHREGSLHIHDLDMLAGYCAGWSLRTLLNEGLNGVPGRVEAGPPKHLSSALGQMVNFLGTLQNEWAGAQAFSSFDTYLAPFIRYDKLSYKEVKQALQEFIFGINQSSRWGNQVPFTNLTFDWTVPDDLRKRNVIIGGKEMPETYEEFSEEMSIINKAFMEVMMEGDMNHRIFTFPIPTYNITRDFDWDSPNTKLLFEMTAKYGTPYFKNFINSSLNPGDVRSMCCRLQLDIRQLRAKTGGLFGSGEQTGSIGVVTINLPRIGFLSANKEQFFQALLSLMVKARISLEIKRKEVEKNMMNGILPYSKEYLGNIHQHFSTIGLIGMHECCLNFLGKGIDSPEGLQFAIEVLDFM